MDRLQKIQQLAGKEAKKISSSPRDWMGYLGTAAKLYRYPFPDTMLVHAQRPDATACVSLEDWNGKVGRWVRRGAKGIALLDDSRAKMKLKYVFDVSDTRLVQGGWTPVLWKMEQRHEAEVLSCLSDTYGLKGKEAAGIGSALMEVSSCIAEENLKEAMRGLDYEVEGRLENAILSCTRTMAGMVSEETARKKKELSQTVSIEEEIRKLEAEKKRFSSRKLRLYEDYRSGNITKEKYRKEYETAASRIVEIEKRIPELKDEVIRIREQVQHMEEKEAELEGLASLETFDKGRLSAVIDSVQVYSEERIEIVGKMNDWFFPGAGVEKEVATLQ